MYSVWIRDKKSSGDPNTQRVRKNVPTFEQAFDIAQGLTLRRHNNYIPVLQGGEAEASLIELARWQEVMEYTGYPDTAGGDWIVIGTNTYINDSSWLVSDDPGVAERVKESILYRYGRLYAYNSVFKDMDDYQARGKEEEPEDE